MNSPDLLDYEGTQPVTRFKINIAPTKAIDKAADATFTPVTCTTY